MVLSRSNTLCGLGRDIAAQKLCPVDLAQAYFEAISGSEFGPRIYARTMPERALAQAEAARDRARTGTRRGLLDGVPLSWKDLFDFGGQVTEAGSALLKGRTPREDAVVVQRVEQAGLVALGKTHMSELAFSGLGLNPVTATPPCINDFDAVSGGSSSGAAASVAFDLAPAAIGSDTGGSVRIPAAWNDLVGLKTTAGRIPATGTVPLCAAFDTVGPLTRNVEDAAALFALLDGTPQVDLRGASLSGVRLAVLSTSVFEDIRDAPADGFEMALSKLAQAGAHVTRIEVPEVAAALALSAVLYTPEAYATWCAEIEANPALMYDRILERFRAGAEFTAADYAQAWTTLHGFRQRYLAATMGYDAVVLPTAPIQPPNAARLLQDSDYYVSENLLALRNTRVANLMGLAAVTLPTGVPSVGLSFQVAPHEEARLLRLAAAAEKALA